jgi:hypothetical protein
MEMTDKLELNLLSNAYDYLNESLVFLARAREEDEQNSWKSAIINLSFCIELLLKERLRREHRLLIYKNLDKYRQINRETITVSWTTLIERLKLILGESFIKLDAGRLNLAQQYRNQMLHYDVYLKFPNVYHDYANILNFITEFYNSFLQKNENDYLHEHIRRNLWKYEDELAYAFVEEIVFYNDIFMPSALKNELESEQDRKYLAINGNMYERIRYGSPQEYSDISSDYAETLCHDCKAIKGQIHLEGCDMERCPKCGGQLITCTCNAEIVES